MNIATENDVVEWARLIVESKGEKYISLPKPALYIIAKWVMNRINTATAVAVEAETPAPSEDTKPPRITTYSPPVISDSVSSQPASLGDTTPVTPYDPLIESQSTGIITTDTDPYPTTVGDPLTTKDPAPLGEAPQEVLEARRMTRYQRLAKQGKDVQVAFEEFLLWSDLNHKPNFVMDFSNGQKSVAAAFTWWLLGLDKDNNNEEVTYGL